MAQKIHVDWCEISIDSSPSPTKCKIIYASSKRSKKRAINTNCFCPRATTTTTSNYATVYHPPQNMYRGVSYDPNTGLWRARIYALGRHVTLGRHATAQEAAFVHDRAAVFIHGKEAQTNYGVEAALQCNARSPPIASWRVMKTLQMLAHECKLLKLAVFRGDVAASSAGRQVSKMPFRSWGWAQTQAQAYSGAFSLLNPPPLTGWPGGHSGPGREEVAAANRAAVQCRRRFRRRHAHHQTQFATLVAIANRLAV